MSKHTFKLSNNYAIKNLDNKLVAYHIPTGNTHILETLSADIVGVFDDFSSLSIESLISHVKKVEQNQYPDDIIETYIRQLIIAGILEPSSNP